MNHSLRAWAVLGLDAGSVWADGLRNWTFEFGVAEIEMAQAWSLRQIFTLYIQNIKLEGGNRTFFRNYFLK
jgi:hypothetical protein